MILPPDEWKRATFPQWAIEAMDANPRQMLTVGMTVFDVSYGGYYNQPKFGKVKSVSPDSSGVVVDLFCGGWCSSGSRHWVPVPSEHIEAVQNA